MAKDPNQVADKWATNLTNSTQSITNGVNAVTTAPGQKAAQAVDLWAQRVAASRNKWATNVGKVTLEEWKSKMINVGIPRVASGATANKPKVASFLTKFLPFQEQVTNSVRAMPKGTIEQSIARMTAQVRGTAAYQG